MSEDHAQAALDVTAAAKLIGVTPSALRRWKLLRQGPPYFMAGRLLRYQREAVLRWISQQTVEPDHTKVS